jgi:L-ascorbate metabolism protein UlaG (beta-lactamase superfamily)
MLARAQNLPKTTVTWLGAAGLAIVSGGRCVLVDPYFSRLPLRRLAVGMSLPDEARIEAALANLPPVAAILVGHTHIDHAFDVPSIARRTAAPVFGSADLDALLTRAGLPQRVTVCRPGNTYALPQLGRFTAFRGAHGGVLLGRPPLPGPLAPQGPYPLRARDYRAGEVLVFDITVGECRIVHVGSAGVADAAPPEGRCDALFLCVPGWQSQPDYPAAYLRRLQPVRIAPFHVDRLDRPLDHPRVLKLPPLVARLTNLPGLLSRLHDLAPDIPVCIPPLCRPHDAAATLG